MPSPEFGSTHATQQEQQLKFELLVAVASPDPSAVMSLNCHKDTFSELFGIHTEDETPAHTSCIGFGMERLTLALFFCHGVDHANWPSELRRRLAL